MATKKPRTPKPPADPSKAKRKHLDQAGRDNRDAGLERQRIEAKQAKLAVLSDKRAEIDAETKRLLGEIRRHEAMLEVLTAQQAIPEA